MRNSSKKTTALATAVAGVILGSASVHAQLFTDTHNDNNPLTVNTVPTWTPNSFAGDGPYTQPDPNDASTITSGPNTIHEGNGTLTIGVTDTSSDGTALGTALSSKYNFWQHPVQLTMNAPVGGNLLPTGVTGACQAGVFLGLTGVQGSRLDNGQALFYVSMSNPDVADNKVATQYVTKGNFSILANDANPFFRTPDVLTATNTTYTSLTLFLDGSTYNRATDTGDLFFNYGMTLITPDGVNHTYWKFNSSGGTYDNHLDGPRHDVAYGPGDTANGGWALGKTNLSTLYDAWTQAGANPDDGLVGDSALAIEFKQAGSGTGTRGPSQVIIGDITAGNPTVVTHFRGDTNGDGVVDLTDYNNVINFFGTAEPAFTNGDSTGDGTVDLNDYNDVINFFGAQVPQAGLEGGLVGPALAAVAIPEPTSLSLLGLASCAMLRRKRR
jgi:hypothetical protein